jgi:hypothetical protein
MEKSILQILNSYLPNELSLKIINYNKYNCYICKNNKSSNFKFNHNYNNYQTCDNCLFLEYYNSIN